MHALQGRSISYGNGQRMEAVKALGAMGIEPPQWWKLPEAAGEP